MATDSSEPKMGIIVTVAVLAVVGFLGMRAFLQSYFAILIDEEEHAKILDQRPFALLRQRNTELHQLENGPVPIEQAMQVIARGARPASIEPRPSTDYSAMQGWLQRRREFTPPPTTIQPGPAVDPNGAMMQGGPSGAAPTAGALTMPASNGAGGTTGGAAH